MFDLSWFDKFFIYFCVIDAYMVGGGPGGGGQEGYNIESPQENFLNTD